MAIGRAHSRRGDGDQGGTEGEEGHDRDKGRAGSRPGTPARIGGLYRA